MYWQVKLDKIRPFSREAPACQALDASPAEMDTPYYKMHDPPQRRRTIVAATRRPVLRLVRVIVEADPEPDVSYLEQEDFEDRSLAYKKGDFSFVGVRAEAEVVIEDVLQTLTSGGLYGVESDSEDEYIDEIAAREWEALRGVLKAVGVPTEQLPLDVQREWIEWRT